MKLLVLALVYLLAIHATADQLATNDACGSCTQSIEKLHNHLSTPLHPRSLVRFGDEVCGSLPAPAQSFCGQLAGALPTFLAQKIARPAQTCERLGACSRREEVLQMARSNDDEDLQCVLCEYVAEYVKEQLEDPQTQEQFIQSADELCQSLPGDLQTQCLQFVDEYGPQIFEFIETEDPEGICALAQLCDETQQLPQLPETLQPQVKQLFEVQDEDTCNTCQLVIVQASAALSDPKTQKKVLKYVKQQCSEFQAFEDQCENYVDLYGPLALNMAKGYLTPDLCTQLGFCSKHIASDLSFSA